jgi:peptidoglycan/xylan/chitin deacetylase (PgdA/CDA1 family)
MIIRLIKISVSALFFTCHIIIKYSLSIIGKEPTPTFVALLYHSIRDEQRNNFERQMDEILSVGKAVTAHHDNNDLKNDYCIAVTFDDGYQNVMRNALPVMFKRNIPPAIFMTTGYLGQRPGWIVDKSHPNYNEVLISKEQLMSLKHSNIVIGSHTVSHFHLARTNRDGLVRELMESRKCLEEILCRKIDLCSLPYGELDLQSSDEFVKAGYNRVFLNVPTYPASNTKKYFMGRISVTPDDWMFEYRLKLRGAYQWLPFASYFKKKVLSVMKGI